jgi:hypothetical protein
VFGVVGYNVQVAVDTEHHLIVTPRRGLAMEHLSATQRLVVFAARSHHSDPKAPT